MLPQKLPLELLSTQWASQLDPLISNPILKGTFLQNIALKMGDNVINLKLGKKQQGYFIVDVNAAAQIYRNAPFNNLTLTLNSDVPCNISLWVF